MHTSTAAPFAAVLRRHRLAAGLTQEALADRATLSVRAISDLERGVKSRPHRDTVVLLATALGLAGAERATFEAARGRGTAAPDPGRDGARRASLPAGASMTPLVGRSHERRLLERHLTGGGPPVLVLAGEPGIGKSRLLQEGAQCAAARGWCVLAGGCTRAGGQLPFAPLLQALAGHLATRTAAERGRDLRGCAWLVRLLPELADELEPLPGWTVSPEQERRLLFEAVRHFLANVATAGGTLLLLDDLQWAGADALELLSGLAHHLPAAPLRIVGAYRDTEVAPGQPLSVLLAELAEAQLAASRSLRPLADQEAVELFAQLRTDLEPVLAAQVVRRVGGVPFFLVSYARGLESEEGAAVSTPSVPWDLRQSIQRRVLALPVAGRALLAAAAVAGRVTPRWVLLAVLGRPEPEVFDALEQACRAGLLEEVGEDALSFVHDVIREVVEGDLGPARRSLLHRQTGEALEARPGVRPAALLAYHYGRSDVPERAVGYLELAGDQAYAQHGHAAAEGYYRETVVWLDRLGRSLEAAQVREKLGTLLRARMQYAEALATLEPAAATLCAAGDLEETGRIEALIAGVYNDCGTLASLSEGLARLGPTLALLAPRGPSRALAALYNIQAAILCHLCRFPEGLAAAEQAEHTAGLAGADEQCAEALFMRGFALSGLGQLPEAVQVLSSAIHVAEAAGDPWRLGWALTFLGGAHQERGLFAASRPVLERALQLTELRGIRVQVLFQWYWLGWHAFFTGEWAEARRNFERAAAIGREVGVSWARAIPALCLGMLCLAEGSETEASEQLAACAQLLAEGLPYLRQLVARAIAERDLLQGRPDLAYARLAPLLAPDALQEEDATPVLPTLVRARLALGEVEAAADLASRAVVRARETGRQVVLADALWVAALVAMRQGRTEEAEAALAEGVALAQQMGYAYGEARLLQGYGELHAQRGQLAPACERLAVALSIFRRLGARTDVAHAEQRLAAMQPCAEAARDRPALPARQTGAQAPSGTHSARADRHAWALERLRTAGPLSPRAYAGALGVSLDTALRDLQHLVSQGLVQAEGRTKNRRYTLTGNMAEPSIHRTGL